MKITPEILTDKTLFDDPKKCAGNLVSVTFTHCQINVISFGVEILVHLV